MKEAPYYVDREEEFAALDREDQIKVIIELFGETRQGAIATLDHEHIETKLENPFNDKNDGLFNHYINQLRLWCKYPVVSTEFVNAMNVTEHYIRSLYGDWMLKALDTYVANENIETLQITPETYDEVTLN